MKMPAAAVMAVARYGQLQHYSHMRASAGKLEPLMQHRKLMK